MITVVTLASGDMQRVWQVAAKTWYPYCERHGYYLHCYTYLKDDTLAPSWNKCLAVLGSLEAASGPVWWIDADMTVADPSVPLEKLIPEHRDIWFSTDWNGLCACMFRVMPTPWASELLKAALLCGDVADHDEFGKGLGIKWEQNTFKTLVKKFPAVAKRVGLLAERYVSDQPPRKAPFWHFGGRTNDVRIAMMQKLHRL